MSNPKLIKRLEKLKLGKLHNVKELKETDIGLKEF